MKNTVTDKMSFGIRPAREEDVEFLFNLVNEDSVRRNSFNSDPISFDEHAHWFNKKLFGRDTMIYIAEISGEPIGQIRLENKDNVGVLSFSVCPRHQFLGIGTKMLRSIIVLFEERHFDVTYLVGYTKKNNIASQKSFRKAGFCEQIEMTYNAYWYPRQKTNQTL